MCVGEPSWPKEYLPPSKLGVLPGAEYLKNLCMYYIKRMITCPVILPSSPIFRAMEGTFSRNSQAAQDDFREECLEVQPDNDWQLLAGNFHSYNAPATAVDPVSLGEGVGFRGGRWHQTQSQQTLIDEE